jgi:hypothetical protein
MKIIDNLPEENEKLLEEETKIVEPKILLEPSQPLALAILDPEPPKEEETSISDFMLKFEDELFDDYRNTSKYHIMKKPQEYKNPSFIDSSEKEFFKKATKEPVSMLSDEWLEESELSPEIIHLDSPSIVIRCQLDKAPFDTFYNPIVSVNIMSALFAQDFLKDMPLAPTTKLLKSLSGRVIPSLGILCALPIFINGTRVLLNFYIFDVVEFDVLIGQQIERLIQEGQTGKLNIKVGKNFNLSMPITRSLNTKIESLPKSDPIEEVKVASLDDPIEPNIEDDAQPFIDEEEDDPVPDPLDELLESPKPSIELKPLPSGLRYVFLNND